MTEETTPDRTMRPVSWLAGAIVATGLVALSGALVPADWLERLAQRIGHEGHVTPERLGRLRVVGLGLAAAHLLLSGLLSIFARNTQHVLSEFWRELTAAHIVRGLRRVGPWVCQPGWAHATALGLVMLVGTGIRLRYLNVPIDYDEAYSFLNYARHPLYEGLSDYDSTNNHLLNTLCMHLAYRSLGPREWALRWHVFTVGVALVGATYALGRTLCGADVGLVAAALVATSALLINYSVNARGYIWVACMTVLLGITSWKMALVSPSSRIVDWIAAWWAAVIGLFAVPTMVYPIAGCLVWLLSQGVRRKQSARWMAGLAAWAALVALAAAWLYAPALVVQGVGAWQHRFVSPLDSWAEWFSRTSAAWSLAWGSWLPEPDSSRIAVVLGAVGVWAMLLTTRQRAIGLLAAIPLGTALVMALQRVAPPPRIFSFLAPIFAIVTAAGAVAPLRGIFAIAGKLLHRNFSAAAPAASWLLAGVLCAWGVYNAQKHPVPGGLRPIFLVEDVGEVVRSAGFWQQVTPDQLWRFSVEAAVAELAPILETGDRVLVALPVDLPFHFYASRTRWAAPIGGQAWPTERLFLVARRNQSSTAVLETNLSLRQFTEPWMMAADWQPWRETGALAIWQAHPAAEAPRE